MCAAIQTLIGGGWVSMWAVEPDPGAVCLVATVGDRITASDTEALAVALNADVARYLNGADGMPSSARLADGHVERTVWIVPLEAGGAGAGLLAVETANVDTLVGLGPQAPRLVDPSKESSTMQERAAEAELFLQLATTTFDSSSPFATDLCRHVADHLGVSRAALFVLADGVVVLRASYDVDEEEDGFACGAAEDGPPVPSAVTKALHRWETTVETRSRTRPSNTWPELSDDVAVLAIPLGSRSEPLGVLLLDRRGSGGFSHQLVRIAEATASELSRLYERASIAGERRRSLRSAAAARTLLQEAARTASVAEAARVAADVGREALGADYACAFLLDGEGLIADVVTSGIGDNRAEHLGRLAIGVSYADVPLSAAFASSAEPVAVVDAASSDLLPAGLSDALALRSLIAMPLVAQWRDLGCVVYGTTSEARWWSLDDRHLVEQLALESSLVLENAQLREAERRHAEELAHQVLHDPLTSLPNRVLLADRLEEALRRTDRTLGQVAVMFLDLVSFKAINDQLGHDSGDRVLIEVAARLQGAVRPGDTVARLAGDEFVVVLPEIDATQALAVSDRLRDAVTRPIAVERAVLTVEVSVGLTLGCAASGPAAMLIAQADAAMYRVKRTGAGGSAVFDARLDDLISFPV